MCKVAEQPMQHDELQRAKIYGLIVDEKPSHLVGDKVERGRNNTLPPVEVAQHKL